MFHSTGNINNTITIYHVFPLLFSTFHSLPFLVGSPLALPTTASYTLPCFYSLGSLGLYLLPGVRFSSPFFPVILLSFSLLPHLTLLYPSTRLTLSLTLILFLSPPSSYSPTPFLLLLLLLFLLFLLLLLTIFPLPPFNPEIGYN